MLRHQRSRASCVDEPDHETDPGGCRNHPLLRWRESVRQQHARRESSFLPIHAGASLDQKQEEHRSIGMEILYTNCAGLDVHKKTVKVCLLTRTSDGQLHKEFRTYFTLFRWRSGRHLQRGHPSRGSATRNWESLDNGSLVARAHPGLSD